MLGYVESTERFSLDAFSDHSGIDSFLKCLVTDQIIYR